ASRETAGSAAAPTARCRKFRRGSFIFKLPLPEREGRAVYRTPPAQVRTWGFPAYGSSLGWVTAPVAVYPPYPFARRPGPEASTCFAGAYSPWPPPFAPPTPLRPPPQTPPQGAFFALFAGFIATMTRSDFSCPGIIGYGSSPSRCGPPYSHSK